MRWFFVTNRTIVQFKSSRFVPKRTSSHLTPPYHYSNVFNSSQEDELAAYLLECSSTSYGLATKIYVKHKFWPPKSFITDFGENALSMMGMIAHRGRSRMVF